MAEMTKLYELQKIDTMSLKVRRRLTQLQAQLVESDELKAVRGKVSDLTAQHHEWHAKQQAAELELQSITIRIEEANQLLMSGQVRNPKELEALQLSVEALQRHRSSIETASVEALLKAEELAGQLNAVGGKKEAVEEGWQRNQSQVTEEDTKLKRAFMQLKKQREQTAAAISAPLLQQYEQMRQRKGGIAVATVENETCSACHVQLPTGILSTLRSPLQNQVICPTCGRILYAA